MNDEERRQREPHDQVCPARPGTEALIADIIEAVTGEDQERRYREHKNSIGTIALRAPGGFYVEGQQRSDDQE